MENRAFRRPERLVSASGSDTNRTERKPIMVCLVGPRLITDCCECTGRNDQVLWVLFVLVSPTSDNVRSRRCGRREMKKRIADGPYSGGGQHVRG
ncbi:hypothetical protein Zmor_005189 [Zophobas morio]|uniref:Uncharacterized protein n=1 Tax=Zophobas morio TaxID=2755281 RepID=A0AA38IU29_9CUCU|nr:hypothetical protein Zmor_005189 [Zophobas morio]